MYCPRCGIQNADDAAYCKRCGEVLNRAGMNNEGNRGERRFRPSRLLIPAAVVLAVVVVATMILVAGPVGASSPVDLQEAERLFEEYSQVDADVDAIGDSFRNEAGYHSAEDVEALLAEVEEYGHSHPEAIADVENNGESVCFKLSDGSLYVFTPSLEGYLAGAGENRIMTLEPWWTDVENTGSLRLETDGVIGGFDDISGVDEWVYNIADEFVEYDFPPYNNLNDSEVSISALKSIGNNMFVLYFGHGGFTDKTGSYLSTGEKVDLALYVQYINEFRSGQLVWSNDDNRVAVTSAFFSNPENFPDGSLEGTDLFLLSCHSLEDSRLSDALIGRGARTVTGFDASVTRRYGIEMLYGLLGVGDDEYGLLDCDDKGQYLTYGKSLSNAKEKYGYEDPYERDGRKARCFIHPASIIHDVRLSDRVMAGKSSNSRDGGAYTAYLKKVEDYQNRYGSHSMATFQNGQEWSTGLAMVQLVDFNGDGNEELLLAYRDADDSGGAAPGYVRDAYHVEVWGCENGSIKQLHTGIPPAGDGGYMPVVLYGNPNAQETKVMLYECEGNGVLGEGHEALESYYGFAGGAFGLLFERKTTTANGRDSVSVSGDRAEMAEAGGGAGGITSYSPTNYYLDGMMKSSSDSRFVDCERVFRITDETVAKLRGETVERLSNASNEEALKKSVAQSAKHEILHWFYADLDNDGGNEAFAITGIQNEYFENEWSEGEIWYADGNGAKRLGGQEAGNAVNGLIEDATSGYKFLSLEHDGHGSGSTSTVFAASDGSCAEAFFDLDPIGHFHEEDGQLVGYTQKWDNGFHEYEWHSFEFDPIGVTFKSTGVVDVTTWR